MDTVLEKRDALAAVGLAAAGFLLLVATTASWHYGLILMPHDRVIWSIARVVPTLGWLSIAGLLILFKDRLAWESAASAFLVTLTVACAAVVVVAPYGVHSLSVVTSVTYYSLISALLCLSIPYPILAGILGPVLLLLQVITDVLAHLGMGVLSMAW